MNRPSFLEPPSRDVILNGPVIRVLLRLGVPVAIGELAHTLYELADIYWLGKVGRVAVAAPSASWPFIWALMATGIGFLSAGVTLVAQYKGANDEEGVKKSLGQVYTFATIIGVLIATAGFFAIPYILRLARIPPDVYPYAVIYSRIEMIGLIIIIYWESFRAVSSASGDTVTPMKLNLIGALANALLDPVFIFGLGPFPRLEVAGAAIATVLTRGAMGIASIYMIVRGHRDLKLEKKYMKPDKKIISLLLKVGAPLSAQYTGEALGFSLLTVIISLGGSVALAAWGIGDRPFNMINFFIMGLLAGCTVMVGQALGAERIDRAWSVASTTVKMVASASFIYGSLLAVFRYPVVSFFINDPEVIEAAAGFMLYMGPAMFMFSLLQVGQAIAQGSGHTKTMMAISLARLWALRNILAYLLGPGPIGLGINGIWIGMSLSNVISGALAVAWIYRKKWLKPVIKQATKQVVST
jgi:putative MATE family efflux protein